MSIFEIAATLAGWSALFGYLNCKVLKFPQTTGRVATVALAASLPVNEYKPAILTITYAVVLFSIIVQGFTIKSLVEHLMSRGRIVNGIQEGMDEIRV